MTFSVSTTGLLHGAWAHNLLQSLFQHEGVVPVENTDDLRNINMYKNID